MLFRSNDTSSKNNTDSPRRFKVIIFNDDFTPYDFVKDLIKKVFRKQDTEADNITMQIHAKGSGIVGVYSRDIAETKVAVAEDHARSAGHPLSIQSLPE